MGLLRRLVNTAAVGLATESARPSAKGYGDTTPVAPNDNDNNKAKNRRVELRKA